MFEEVKERLLEDPQQIISILEAFGYAHITLRNNEIRFGFEEGSNPNGIALKLVNNDNLFVKDFIRGDNYDLLNFIVKNKRVEFRQVVNVVKQTLGIDSLCAFKRQVGLFNGIYDNITRSSSEVEIKTYPENILDQYIKLPCDRFLRDGLSLESQRRFEVGYDIISQRIVFPIRNTEGSIIAVKGRINYESEDEAKYLYLQNGSVSSCLYGLFQNYNFLYLADEIFVLESEKSCIKLDSWGIHNAVALMSNNLSSAQAKLLMAMCPRKVIFMLDEGLSLENTLRNAEVLKTFTKMREVKVFYWDWRDNIELPPKSAPVDGTKEQFEWILKNEIKSIEELEEKEDGEL